MAPGHWLAFLRITVGLWFLTGLAAKVEPQVVSGWLPLLQPADAWLTALLDRLAEYAAGNPLVPYAMFLREAVIPNGEVVAYSIIWAELAIGIGLTLGLMTRLAAGIGFLLSFNYLLASFWMGPSQQGFHPILLACMVAFIGAGAGRKLGMDAWLTRLIWRGRSMPAVLA